MALVVSDVNPHRLYVSDYNSGSEELHLLSSKQTHFAWPAAFGAGDDEIVAYQEGMFWWDFLDGDLDWTDNWTQMTAFNPDFGDTIVANFDSDSEEELVVDILNQIWSYNYSSATKWTRLNAAPVLDIRSWPQDVGSDDELVVSFFNTLGLWKYDHQASPKWTRLNGLTPDADGGYVEIFNADGDLDWDLAVDFGNQSIGLWRYNPDGTPKWTSLNGNNPVYMVRADLDGDGDDELVVKFASPSGIWVWNDDTSPKWKLLNGNPVD
jgi:hypothetical protein